MTGDPVDQGALVSDLTSTWLADLGQADRERALPLARKLVADWAQEADPMPDPAAVVRFQREALEATAAQTGGGRLRALELELLRRRADRLSATALQLGLQVVDGNVADDDAGRRGRALLDQCEQLASELAGFDSNAATDAVRRSLEEATLDALYAVERKAMSPRLARARPAAGGPPDIR
jgi:hypothetical protein